MTHCNKIHYFFATFLIALFLFGCKSNSSTEVIKLVSASGPEFGEFVITGADQIEIENEIGGIILNGSNSKDTIQYYLNKMVRAETVLKAESEFSEIKLINEQEDNSIKYSIFAPENSAYYEYYCSMSLDIPYELPCSINQPNKGVHSNYLDSTLIIQNSTGMIEVTKHTGSCDVKTSLGNIFIETILPEKGFCRSYSASGNIRLEILVNTSATIYAKTADGLVSYENLTILDLEESDDQLIGKLGSGDGEIYLETNQGNIEIVGFN